MSQPDDHSRAHLLFDLAELQYDFGEGHPLQPRRLVALMDLLESSGLWQRSGETSQLPLRAATDEELGLVHSADYIAVVKRLSMPEAAASQQERQELLLETSCCCAPMGCGKWFETGRLSPS